MVHKFLATSHAFHPSNISFVRTEHESVVTIALDSSIPKGIQYNSFLKKNFYDPQIDKRLNRCKSKVKILLVNVDYQALIPLTLCRLVPGRKYKLLSKKR